MLVANVETWLIKHLPVLMHTNRPLVFTHTPRMHHGPLYINSANNRKNVIGSDTCHTCRITHDTTCMTFITFKQLLFAIKARSFSWSCEHYLGIIYNVREFIQWISSIGIRKVRNTTQPTIN